MVVSKGVMSSSSCVHDDAFLVNKWSRELGYIARNKKIKLNFNRVHMEKLEMKVDTVKKGTHPTIEKSSV